MTEKVCSKCGKSSPDVKFPSKGRTCNSCIAANSNAKRKARVEAGEYVRQEFAISIGLTHAEYLAIQEQPCGICGKQPTEAEPSTAYQNRRTKNVVGAICRKCSTAMGMFDHNLVRVLRAAEYLSD
jgi:hypothetical protein